jgi:hypothetical protein
MAEMNSVPAPAECEIPAPRSRLMGSRNEKRQFFLAAENAAEMMWHPENVDCVEPVMWITVAAVSDR